MQINIFGESSGFNKNLTNISGLKYIPNYIDILAEKHLIQEIDEMTWINDLKRRVQHY